jgi:flagellar basal body-associated protein FliL
MKKSIVFVGVGVVLAAGGAFFAAGVVQPKKETIDWRSLRGKDEYFAKSEEYLYDVPDLNVNLKGSGGQRYLTVGVGVKYRLGGELLHPANEAPVDSKAPFEKAKLDVRDRLTILLSNKTLEDLEGREKHNALKQEMLEEIAAAVFPDQTGRIEAVFLRQLLVQ